MNNTVILENSTIVETYAKFTETLRAVLGELSFSVMPYGDQDTHLLCRSSGHSLIQFYTYRERNKLRLQCTLNFTPKNLQEMTAFEEEFSSISGSILNKFGHLGVSVKEVILQIVALTSQAKSFLQNFPHVKVCTVKFQVCVLNQVDNVLEYANCLFEGHRSLRFKLKNFFENNLSLDILCDVRMSTSNISSVAYSCIQYMEERFNEAVRLLEIPPQTNFDQTKLFAASDQTFEAMALDCLAP